MALGFINEMWIYDEDRVRRILNFEAPDRRRTQFSNRVCVENRSLVRRRRRRRRIEGPRAPVW
jgi:hypothetical protein